MIDTPGTKRYLTKNEVGVFLIGQNRSLAQAIGLAADLQLKNFVREKYAAARVPDDPYAPYDFSTGWKMWDFKCSGTGNFSVSGKERSHLLSASKTPEVSFSYLLYDMDEAELSYTHLGEIDAISALDDGLLLVSQHVSKADGTPQYYIKRESILGRLIPTQG